MIFLINPPEHLNSYKTSLKMAVYCPEKKKRIDVKINVLEVRVFWSVFWQQTAILDNYVICEVRGVCFIESQSNKIVILVP